MRFPCTLLRACRGPASFSSSSITDTAFKFSSLALPLDIRPSAVGSDEKYTYALYEGTIAKERA